MEELKERVRRIRVSVERLERWVRQLESPETKWREIPLDGLRRESSLLLKRVFLLWVRLRLPQGKKEDK